jgi:hypothetical protein
MMVAPPRIELPTQSYKVEVKKHGAYKQVITSLRHFFHSKHPTYSHLTSIDDDTFEVIQIALRDIGYEVQRYEDPFSKYKKVYKFSWDTMRYEEQPPSIPDESFFDLVVYKVKGLNSPGETPIRIGTGIEGTETGDLTLYGPISLKKEIDALANYLEKAIHERGLAIGQTLSAIAGNAEARQGAPGANLLGSSGPVTQKIEEYLLGGFVTPINSTPNANKYRAAGFKGIMGPRALKVEESDAKKGCGTLGCSIMGGSRKRRGRKVKKTKKVIKVKKAIKTKQLV